jgi:hypothetical protein
MKRLNDNRFTVHVNNTTANRQEKLCPRPAPRKGSRTWRRPFLRIRGAVPPTHGSASHRAHSAAFIAPRLVPRGLAPIQQPASVIRPSVSQSDYRPPFAVTADAGAASNVCRGRAPPVLTCA